jgi:hypothetical protein
VKQVGIFWGEAKSGSFIMAGSKAAELSSVG